MNPALRFGTCTAVDGATAQVRFPGGAEPHPVTCVDAVPTVGQKVAVWATFDRLFYITGGGTGPAGPQGPAGPAGPTGPQGPPGPALVYVHTQSVPAAVWTIAHQLGYHPAVTVVDSAGSQMFGALEYPDVDTVTARFSAAFGGKAYCS